MLVGPMGAGKTTVGQLLARRLGLAFLDTDQVLEARTGVSIATIFEIEGEQQFRAREAALIAELLSEDRVVIATGGGAILSDATRELLARRARVIYLHATPETSYVRVRKSRDRPLLNVDAPLEKLKSLYAVRDPLYRSVAHLIVNTGEGPPSVSVERIIEALARGTATDSSLH
ncbi:MAG: shikimate kinase [Casimicrobiaceae bacterium]